MGSAFYGERLRDIVYWGMVEYLGGDGDCTLVTPLPRIPRVSILMEAPTPNRQQIHPRIPASPVLHPNGRTYIK